jgi:hypothetical protein
MIDNEFMGFLENANIADSNPGVGPSLLNFSGASDISDSLIGTSFPKNSIKYNPDGGFSLDLGGVKGLQKTAQNNISQNSSDASKLNKKVDLGNKINMGIGMGAGAIGDIAGAEQNLNTNQYLTDLDYWKKQGKWWFDKNADYAPTFEEFAPDMPSAEDAAKKNIGWTIAGGAAKGAEVGAAFGPEGAGVGALAGGVIGTIEGIMSWKDGKAKDAKEKERAYNEYKQQLKEWTFAKNNKNRAEVSARTEGILSEARAIGENKRVLAQQKESTDIQRAASRRSQLVDILQGAGSIKDARNKKMASRWA